METKTGKTQLEQENAQLKKEIEKLKTIMAEMDGERLSHKMVADEAVKMLTEEQRQELSVIVVLNMTKAILKGKIPNDDNKYNQEWK